MKKRFITVPKDKEAEEALDFGNAEASQLIELTLDENEFYKLYEAGIFKLINYVGNANIDDFEDESIVEIEDIENVIIELTKKETTVNKEIFPHVLKIIKLFEEARNRRTGVFFYF